MQTQRAHLARLPGRHRERRRAMPKVLRPRRSLLFMPGSSPRALEKARTLPADGLIFDLEDAVGAEAKEGARAIIAAALAAGGYGGRELVLRVNPLDTPWGHADLAAAADIADRRGAAAEGRERRPGAADRVAARRVGGAGAACGLVHAGNATRDPLRPRDRRGEPAACSTGPRHSRSDEGSARNCDARSLAADHLVGPRDAGRPRL